MLKINIWAYLQQTNAFFTFTNKISNLKQYQMGLFGNNNLTDEIVELEWTRQNTNWGQRVSNFGFGKIMTLLLILGGTIFFVRMTDNERKLTWDKVKANDKLYVSEFFITDTSGGSVPLRRMIRPINQSDIDTMNISLIEKRKMSAQLDTSNTERRIIDICDIRIPQDSIFKFGTAFVGTFLSKDSTTKTFEDKTADKFYAIIPNSRLVQTGYDQKIPKGYVLANNYYYVMPENVRLEEPNALKSHKTPDAKTTAGPAADSSKANNQPVSPLKRHKHKHKHITNS
jgi:hypothetical protein